VVEHLVVEPPQHAILSGKIDQISIFENFFTVAPGDVATGTVDWVIRNEKKGFSLSAAAGENTGPTKQGIRIGLSWDGFHKVQIERAAEDVVFRAIEANKLR